jgi:hypothetical protein
MLKVLVWLAGDAALVYAIEKLGYWREVAAVALAASLVFWVLGGAMALSRPPQPPQVMPPTDGPFEHPALKAYGKVQAPPSEGK